MLLEETGDDVRHATTTAAVETDENIYARIPRTGIE